MHLPAQIHGLEDLKVETPEEGERGGPSTDVGEKAHRELGPEQNWEAVIGKWKTQEQTDQKETYELFKELHGHGSHTLLLPARSTMFPKPFSDTANRGHCTKRTLPGTESQSGPWQASP